MTGALAWLGTGLHSAVLCRQSSTQGAGELQLQPLSAAKAPATTASQPAYATTAQSTSTAGLLPPSLPQVAETAPKATSLAPGVAVIGSTVNGTLAATKPTGMVPGVGANGAFPSTSKGAGTGTAADGTGGCVASQAVGVLF